MMFLRTSSPLNRRTRYIAAASVLVALLAGALPALAGEPTPPSFSKVFSPDTIAAGSSTVLTFTIDNTGSSFNVEDLAFSDTLPVGVTLANPSSAQTTCTDAVVTAPGGGSTISMSGGLLPGFTFCEVSVVVTSSVVGTHMNVSGDLTSNAGSSGNATDDLMVVADRPGFSKIFSPATVPLGRRSTLTFTIDNSALAVPVNFLQFTDTLPVGTEIADPANASTTCLAGAVMAPGGGNTISLTGDGTGFLGANVAAMSTCTVSVDVVGTGVGPQDNLSGELFGIPQGSFFQLSSGFATDRLTVTADPLVLIKEFTDDPVVPGGTVTLEFSILNRDRFDAATGITFTDDLSLALSGLTAIGLPANDVCGAGSVLSGSTLLTLSGGNLPAEGSCNFSVTLSVPAGATPGAYTNTTSQITGDVAGSPVTGAAGQDLLFVSEAPQITKSFIDDPVTGGGTVTLEFTISNVSATSSATGVTFSDEFSVILPSASVVPTNGDCGGGSTFTFMPLVNPPPPSSVIPARLTLTGGTLAPAGMAGDSCTFSITLNVEPGAAPGIYPNVTSGVTATVGGTSVTGPPAMDDLVVVTAPRLDKEFTDDPVDPGDTVTLEFTLTHDELAPTTATGITFSDNLDAVLTGLAAVGLPMNDVCGAGSQISGTSTVTLTGGTLMPGESCVFSITLQVPPGVDPGPYTNVTSSVSATVGGITATELPAMDTLQIAGLRLTKEFTDDPVIPGRDVTLEFTLENLTPSTTATSIIFSDDLSSVLSGLTVDPGSVPATPCGAGSSIVLMSGNTFISFSAPSLAAASSCTFSLTLEVPAGAADGVYGNFTQSFFASFGGGFIPFENAADALVVDGSLLSLTKTFTDDPVAPGDPVTLEFTLTNTSAVEAITDIEFSDDLDAALSGLIATAVPMDGFCGVGSTVVGNGTGNLTILNASLAPLASCTFQVTLQVPVGVPPGTVPLNITSSVLGLAPGEDEVTGPPAAAVLELTFLTFSKSFDGPTVAGGAPTLTFTLVNPDTSTATDLGFSDDLDAVLSGLVATNTPQTDPCGTGSSLTGTSLLTLSGASLPPMGGTCVIVVTLQVPAGAMPGSYLNTTGDLFQAGLPVAQPATATLTVEPPPTFAKAFAQDPIAVGGVTTLTFTIDNTASALAATALDFADPLPAGLEVASAPNASTSCTGGTITAAAGSGTVSYTGGSVLAGATCTVSVDITATAAGDFVNTTGDLMSSSGNSGPASDTLRVNPPPGFLKAFAPTTIVVGGVSTLTLTIDNTASTAAATGLDVTDTLPTGMTVATPANPVTTCTGGTVTATSGSGTVSYTGGSVAAGATCTLSVDVTSVQPGANVNTTGDLTSSLGNSGTAEATLTVDPPPAFTKAFAPDTITVGGVSTLTLTIDNGASTQAATGLDFTDTLPTGMTVATPANAATTCTGGTVTAASGAGTVSYSGGSVAAGASCTVSADVTSAQPGANVNTTGDLTSSLGNSGTAEATLTVNFAAVGFTKSFAPDIVQVGVVSTLTLVIDNSANPVPVGNLDFTDNLPAGLEVASPANASTTCTGGTLSAASGATSINYTGGTVAAASTCVVVVDVVATTVGSKQNVTGDLTSEAGTSPPAQATLTVVEDPDFTKTFLSAPVLPGGMVELEFTIVNSSTVSSLTEISFSDDLDTVIPGLVAVGLPQADVCGAGSTLAGTSVISLTDGVLPSGGSCTFAVTLTVPPDVAPGSYGNTTSPLTGMAILDGGGIVVPPATATLTVAYLDFTKVFLDDPAQAGSLTVLSFTITNPDPVNQADGITFSDDLDAVLNGLEAVDTPLADACGAGSSLTGTSVITLMDGILPPGGACTFDVTLQIPPDAAAGTVTNLTSALDAMVNGLAVAGGPASAAQAMLAVEFNVIEVPTLSTWGLVILTALLAAFALARLRRG